MTSPLTCPPRFCTPRNFDRPTLGPRIGEVAAALGTSFMPWQQYVADVIGEIDPDTGLLVYREYDVVVPRQSGKTTLVLAKYVHRAFGFGGPQKSTYTAQTRNDARKKLEDDQIPVIRSSPLRKQVRKYRMTNGNEAIIWRNGSMHSINSTTEKAGHGQTLDEGMIDEAFAHVDARVEQSMRPAMLTRKQAQIGVLSTAGTAASLFLRAKVDRGRLRTADDPQRSVAYFEWSAPDDAPWDEPATWWRCMPALGITVTEATIRAELEGMDEAEFRRAYLNQWVDRGAKDCVIPNWDDLVGASPWDEQSPTILGVDMSTDRAKCSIAGAARTGDRVKAELSEYRDGGAWAVDRIVEMCDKRRIDAVVIDAKGPASTLLPDLEAAGLPLVVTGWEQMAAACATVYDLAAENRLEHSGQPILTAAVRATRKRPLNDKYAWTRKGSASDISPFVAVTLAVYGLMQARPDYDVLDSIY